MATPDHDSTIHNFRDWIETKTCYSVANLNSDEKRPFVPLRAVKAYLEENQNARLNNILGALYQAEDPPTYAEAILRRYTAVFCILLEIGKGHFIHRFTEHNALSDCCLPFHLDARPASFPTTTDDVHIYQEFCQIQWKYSVAVFNRLSGQTFPPEQILPIVYRDALSRGVYNNLWKIRIHKDYNHLQSQNVESVGTDLAMHV